MKHPIDMEEAVDIVEIQRLLFTNLRATDERDWDAFEESLADELEIEFVGLQKRSTISRKQLRAQSEPNYANVRTQHMSTNLDVRVEGDTATSTSYGRALHAFVGDYDMLAADKACWQIYARYEHSYVRTTAGWKISRILMEPRWQEGNPHLLADAADAKA